mmetsp:Transcript_3451/g.6654  ORF Transcript_3451/g.6654 Transcript_3451/m.6654 type:complete len:592 (-) Transcript_3451:149-1924(-)|eukprot:CAMPEP_0201657458 /NCGR_PEP_ID=MMETSP0494-20130426/712_1 /ASSEMBLY_ACC=CAM_ASM_000839 /TAXON_ID=420259 /ORGANISM="Thalassiosira gravida, Strain GMp14c1" /LENGTH=591 /DNA_ID=CAMNT_0048134313 /DNA_START=36 /DNA_END=1811 /DNA_ORIENTATION=-
MAPPNASTRLRRCALLALLAAVSIPAATADDVSPDDDTLVLVEDFSDPLHVWRTFGDPHMGGTSDGSFTVDRYEGVGRFFGAINELPPRQGSSSGSGSPGIGFFRAETGSLTDPSVFPDARTCEGLRLKLRTENWGYQGFLLGFGSKRPKSATGSFSRARGYRADLILAGAADGVGSDEYVDVNVPFTAFTMEWNAGTGGAISTCADNVDNCPDDEVKRDLRPLMVYAKGYTGTFDLRIKTIYAYGCDPVAMAAMQEADAGGSDEPEEIIVEDFSRPGGPINEWTVSNDPVMGGESYSSVEIERGVAAKFTGYTAVVPKLKVPGFVTMATGKSGRFAKGKPAAFPDISNCDGFEIEGRSDTQYTGYYMSFGTDKAPKMRHGRGYKARVDGLPSSVASTEGDNTPKWAGRLSDKEFGTVTLPFASFSSYWDEGSGKTMIECSEDDPQYCPSLATLRNIETVSLWGEGVEGDVALDVRLIKAVGCRSGRYAKMLRDLGVADDGHSGHTYGFNLATLLPGASLAAACLALAAVARNWWDKRPKPEGPYGEVPPISAETEVNVLRSEVVEMRKVMNAMGSGGGGGGSAENGGTFA